MAKKRILFCSEYSQLCSGFGTYYKEVISRLFATGKYELAEFASYGKVNDPKDVNIAWKYYANMVEGGDPRIGDYSSRASNQFGEWRFDKVCLDFKPDIVVELRDFWMGSYQAHSPLRKYYHWCLGPTIDSHPQPDEWLDIYLNADSIFPYSDYGRDILIKECGGKAKVICTASPGVHPETFYPCPDKAQHRQQFLGAFQDYHIIGTIMRNQKRKLFPDLVEGFRRYLDKLISDGKSAQASKTLLYLHTSYPDANGWDIPTLIKEYKVGNKILMTYVCRECKYVFPSFFYDAKTVCPRCQVASGTLSSVGAGCSQEELRNILCLFDIYVQCATNEGFGMPQVEAASCGLPVFSTDYSAMSDVVRKLGGYPIKVNRKEREISDNTFKVTPDINHMVKLWDDFFKLPKSLQLKKGMEARQNVEKYYTWDKTAKIYEDYFDKLELAGQQGKWEGPFNPIRPNLQAPPNLTNEQFVSWAIINVLQEPDKLNTYFAASLVRHLNLGVVIVGNRCTEQYTRDALVQGFINIVNNKNSAEQVRSGMAQLPLEDFIEYARLKEAT